MISGPLRLPNVHDSGSPASVAAHALMAARWSAVVSHWSGEGLRSAGHEPEARAPRRPSWMRVPLAPRGIGVQPVAVGVAAGVAVTDVVGDGAAVVAECAGAAVVAAGSPTSPASPTGGGTAPSASAAMIGPPEKRSG